MRCPAVKLCRRDKKGRPSVVIEVLLTVCKFDEHIEIEKFEGGLKSTGWEICPHLHTNDAEPGHRPCLHS